MKLSTRFLVPVAVVAIPLSLHSLYDSAAGGFRKDEKCFQDVEYKRGLLELAQRNAAKIIQAYKEQPNSRSLTAGLAEPDQNQISIPKDYLTDAFVKDLSCSRLKEILIQKKRAQDALVGRLSAGGIEDPRKKDANIQDQQLLRALTDKFQCASKEKRMEILCAAGNVMMMGRSLSNVLNPETLAHLKTGVVPGSESVKTFLVRKKSAFVANDSAIDIEEYKKKMEAVWKSEKMSEQQKIAVATQEYIQRRTQAMAPERRLQAEEVLGDIQMTSHPKGFVYDAAAKTMFLNERALHGHKLGRSTVVSHELEHVGQYGFVDSDKDFVQKVSESYWKMLKERKRPQTPIYSQQAEYEAIGAQWDFLQGIPANVRNKAARALTSDQHLDPDIRRALVHALDNASSDRGTFIRRAATIHGYTGERDVEYGAMKAVDYAALAGMIYYLVRETPKANAKP